MTWLIEFLIEKILQEPSQPNHNDFEKVIHARSYRESHNKKTKNRRQQKEEKEEEHTAEITYESEFESEFESENDNDNDSNVVTEISATETTE